MPIEKRIFSKGMNGDDSPRLLDSESSFNIMNARFASASEFGRGMRLENIPGTTLVQQSVNPPYGLDQTIGSVFDSKRNRIIFANYNTFDDHAFFAYDIVLNVVYAVLYDSQVIGGLGFDPDFRIDRNMKVIGDLLYWTDNLNRQRKINIERGIVTNTPSYVSDYEAYDWPMNQEVISLLKRPPLVPLEANKVTQSSPNPDNNFIKTFSGQFAWRYYYMDGETSVVSVYSELMNYNSPDETYNAIDITFPQDEVIDQDVQRVDLIVREGNTNNFYVIRSWDKAIFADEQEILAHNDGSAVLEYRFYNDKKGEVLDYLGYVFKPFDSVPILSKTLEIAQNRLFLGNNVIGYDTPVLSSLTAEFETTTEGATVTGTWYELQWGSGGFGSANLNYVVYINTLGGSQNGYYGYLPFPGPEGSSGSPPFLPGTADYPTELTLVGYNISDILLYFSVPPAQFINFIPKIDTTTVTNPPSTTSMIGNSVFRPDSSYQLGIVFYDFGDRKCGVFTTDELIHLTPDREYDELTFSTGLNWTLVNTNAVNEIPDWATHYSIVVTRNLTTRFFLEAKVADIKYATKDADGLFEFTATNYLADNAGIGIDITLLTSYAMGYTFTEGDLVKLYIDGDATVYTLAIIAQQGNWIVAELHDIGTLTGSPKDDVLFHIYTPYQQAVTEPFYEVAQTFQVINPGEPTREYSQINGTIGGDVTILSRVGVDTVEYLTVNMSPNDKFYLNWYTDVGRTNFVTHIGQTEEPNTIAFSNTYIIGSRLNGLSSFDPLSESEIPLECGSIQKLQLTSKVQNELGVVMLAVCAKETASLYLGEVQQYGSNQQTTLTISEQVIGTINVLKGTRGTITPESVIMYEGLVTWIDTINGVIVQYSVNGLEDVSRYKQARFFQRYCNEYQLMSAQGLDNINGFHHIPSCFDPFNREYIITLPALIYSNYAEVLPSYSSVPIYATNIFDYFDIFDQLGKTMAFCFDENRWGQNYEFMGEWYEYGNSLMFGFKNGSLYIHNADTTNWNNFYGTQYPVRTLFPANFMASALKNLNHIAIESNAAPNWTVAMSDWPNEQITDLTADDYTDQEGFYYAEFFMDRLSPNASGTADERLYTGDDVTGVVLMIQCEWQAYDSLLWVNFINIGYSWARGQKQILKPINQ